jgi:hypothetical protein
LVAEFERCRAGGLPPPLRVPTPEEAAAQAAAKKKEEEDAKRAEAERQAKDEALQQAKLQQEELEQGWLPMSTPVPSESKRAEVAAWDAILEKDLAHVWHLGTPDALCAGLAVPLSQCSRAGILIAAPTSGWSAINAYLETAAQLVEAYKSGHGGQHKIRIVILAGTQFDMVAKVQEPRSEPRLGSSFLLFWGVPPAFPSALELPLRPAPRGAFLGSR